MKTREINGKNYFEEDIWLDCNSLDENEFRDYLNEVHGEIEVCGVMMPACQVLEELEPREFQLKYDQWIDGLLTVGEIIEVEKQFYKVEDIEIQCISYPDKQEILLSESERLVL